MSPKRFGARRLFGLGTGAALTTLALSTAPALAGAPDNTLTLKGATTANLPFTSCAPANSSYGPGLTVTYGPANETASDYTVRLVEYGKKPARRANLHVSDRYFLELSFWSNGVLTEYEAGAEQHPNKTYSHVGSGTLEISANLETATLKAHMINAYHPSQPKLSVVATWSCAAS